MSTNPYGAISMDVLRVLVASWEASAGAWTREQAIVDLAVTVDTVTAPHARIPWPSLTDFARRWGWVSRSGKPSVKRVRLLLADHGSWLDGHKVDALVERAGWSADTVSSWVGARPGHVQGTARARRGHDEGTPREDEPRQPDATGHYGGTTGARSGHDEGTARATRAENNHRPPSTVHRPPSDTHTGSGGSGSGVCAGQTAGEVWSTRAQRWISEASSATGWSPEDVARACKATVDAVRQDDVSVNFCGSAVDALVRLVTRLDLDAETYLGDLEQLGRAIHDETCKAWPIAVGIRGEGKPYDHRASGSVWLKPDKWTERVEAARAWYAEAGAGAATDAPHADEVHQVARELAACDRAGATLRPIGVPVPSAWKLDPVVERHEQLLAAVLYQAPDGWRAWLSAYRDNADALVARWPLADDFADDLFAEQTPEQIATMRGRAPVDEARRLGVELGPALSVIEGGEA